MSPANIDGGSGQFDAGAARPLTRKELRAREKNGNTGLQGIVPEQAYETGQDTPVPPLPAVPPASAAAPSVHASANDPAPTDDAAQANSAAPAHDAAIGGAAPLEPPVSWHQAEPATAPIGRVAPSTPAQQDQVVEPSAGQHQDHEAPQPDMHDYHEGLHTRTDDHHGGHYGQEHFDHPQEGVHYDDGHYQELLPGAGQAPVVPKVSKKVRRRRRLLALFLTLAVFVTAVAVGAQFLKPLLGTGKPGDYPGPGSGEVVVTVQNGEGTGSVAATLEDEGVVANADTFLQAFTASGGTLSPGDYTFRSEMKNADAVNVLLGKDKTKVIYFALSAGLRIGESLQAISEGSGISVQELQALSNQPAQFGLPAAAKNLEGYLAPGEHRLPLGTPAKEILQSLVKITVDELVAQGITDPAKQYQTVIVASIVQAEGGQAEYRDVAGAIYNRLEPNDQTNGFLQVDSAVTYGLGTKSYNFTEEQRRDSSNPYNTYANPGLPPGPIGSPGKTAIDAAAKPKTNDYLYWVTINLDTKETRFSRTLAEHNVYVEQYNAWCMANVGRCT